MWYIGWKVENVRYISSDFYGIIMRHRYDFHVGLNFFLVSTAKRTSLPNWMLLSAMQMFSSISTTILLTTIAYQILWHDAVNAFNSKNEIHDLGLSSSTNSMVYAFIHFSWFFFSYYGYLFIIEKKMYLGYFPQKTHIY